MNMLRVTSLAKLRCVPTSFRPPRRTFHGSKPVQQAEPSKYQTQLHAARTAFNKTRFLYIPLLKRYKAVPYSLSDIPIHASFALLTLSYLETDFLNLREFATCSISLTLLSQYLSHERSVSLIGWSAVFWIINVFMITLLLAEKKEANNITDEQKMIYDKYFRPSGMSSVDFLHLFHVAQRDIVNSGDILIQHNQPNATLYFFQSCNATISRGDTELGTISPGQYAGTMGFLSWKNTMQQSPETAHKADSAIIANIKASTALKQSIERFRQILRQCLTDMGYLLEDGVTRDDIVELLHGHEDCCAVSPRSPTTNLATVPVVPGQADVIVAEDGILYKWDFMELLQLCYLQPSLGESLSRCLTHDLSTKMNASYTAEPKQRYRQLLLGAVVDGMVNEATREFLKTFRESNEISDKYHVRVLRELGWSEEEYNIGFKGSANDDALTVYMELVKKILRSGRLSYNDRIHLIKYRQAFGIRPEQHVAAITAVGWSLEEYEIGEKSGYTPAVMASPVADDGSGRYKFPILTAIRRVAGV